MFAWRHGNCAGAVVLRNTDIGAGNYYVQATYQGQTAKAAIAIRVPGDPTIAQIPAPGGSMIRVATPTTADHRGVEPICTRDPVCPLHDVSLDAALDEKRPLVVLFSTPKLCQTAVCGPVLETLLGLQAAYESKVRFLHMEIYADASVDADKLTTSPVVNAYHLEGEPFLFFADANGKVAHLIDGLVGRAEIEDGLKRITAGR